ncbi:MAG TPA: alpha/beta hydrolase [Edaphobacter sp.]|nr:alpha/beta hydrolase [Edaphobacter sp.]
MANFVLVHGGWYGGWIWKRVARHLRDKGHDVYTPTLTGLADRSHLLTAGVNLSTHIQDIVSLIQFEELKGVILCGHSYGGMVISGVADRISEHISSLVYLDAWYPNDGDSLFTLSSDAAQLANIKNIGRYGGIARPPIPADVLNVNERDRAWVEKMSTLHPAASMFEGIRLQGNHLKVKKLTYIMTSLKMPQLMQFYERLQKDPAWITRTIESGHDAMLDNPEGVVKLLHEAIT